MTPKTHVTRGCPVCKAADIQNLANEVRQCLMCGSHFDRDLNVITEGAVDPVERVLGTTPAQPLPEAAHREQEGAPDLDRVRGTTPPQPLPVDAHNEARVLGETPPQPLPADAGQPAPAPVYADTAGNTSDTPPEVHGEPVSAEQVEPAPLLKPKIAEAVENAPTPEKAEKAAQKMPAGDGSPGDQPEGKDSYSTTSGWPTGETKIVTPKKAPKKPKIDKG